MWYEIRVRGQLDGRWSAWFDGLAVTDGADGEAVLTGPVADQAALHGLLAKVRDLGLPLVAVNPVADPTAESPGRRQGQRLGYGDDA
jgi:hypothetical protein